MRSDWECYKILGIHCMAGGGWFGYEQSPCQLGWGLTVYIPADRMHRFVYSLIYILPLIWNDCVGYENIFSNVY